MVPFFARTAYGKIAWAKPAKTNSYAAEIRFRIISNILVIYFATS